MTATPFDSRLAALAAWVQDMPGWQYFLAFWGTVILAAAAVTILAARR